ncbi:c-type cytochrome [Oceanicella sp. SM1341]|uniref:c-type cytochrome n=1 Tax=Oceanicella sp. SM1341 TaxID=1548889 RepID=UPI001E5CCD75|nr:c-type cytochrome [Oceanicella sp. SM1341]
MRRRLRIILLTLAACAGAGAVGGAAVVGLGLYNVSASAGHLPGVSWLLHSAFRASVRLRAPAAEEVPDLSDPARAALGAGHYATACAPCHGGPDAAAMATVRHMVPEPPPVAAAVAQWQPRHLHWIVENGVKMTGMPAWPAEERGDEVWAVVAWAEALKRGEAPPLPQTAQGTAPGAGPEARAGYCLACHGAPGGGVPRLDIQEPAVLAAAMRDYRSGTRQSGIMAQAMSFVPPEQDAALAGLLAGTGPERLPRPAPPPEGAGALATRGTRDVPACTACHGPDAEGDRPGRFPALAGQDATFLATELRLWRDGVRKGSPLMRAAARRLTEAQITALAAWYAAREPAAE